LHIAKGSKYLNVAILNIYKDEEANAAIPKADANYSKEAKKEPAQFSLMMSHLEKCFADLSPQKDFEHILALEIFRVMEENRQKLTKGILKAFTIMYQDMFRVRNTPALQMVPLLLGLPLPWSCRSKRLVLPDIRYDLDW
jgi:hypothetical protein